MGNVLTGARLVLWTAAAICAAAGLSSRGHAADMATKAPPQATENAAPSSVVWLGSDFKNDVDAGVIGGIYALSGNLDAPGWLVRGQFTYVGYDFNTTQSATGSAHTDFYRGDSSIGYQIVGNGLVASGFVGVDYERYFTNPAAATNTELNDKVGAIFSGHLATVGGAQYPFAIDGHFSTANNDYWIRGRTGVKFNNITVGPEIIGLGNVSFDEVRVGGYASYDLSRTWILQGDLGYAQGTRGNNNNSGRGGDGAYSESRLSYTCIEQLDLILARTDLFISNTLQSAARLRLQAVEPAFPPGHSGVDK